MKSTPTINIISGSLLAYNDLATEHTMSFLDKLFGPPSKDRFGRMLLSAVVKAGETGRVVYDRAENRLRLDKKGGLQLYLDNAYLEYCSVSRSSRKGLFQKWVRMWFASRKEKPTDYADIKHDLLPTLKPRIYYENARALIETDGDVPPDWPYQILEDPLVVGLVYDEPESTRTISQDDLNDWGVTFYEAMEVARENLTKLPFRLLGPGERNEGVYLFMTGDSYDATRLLLLDQVRSLKVTGEHVVMVPNRESLIVTGTEDENGLKAMLDLAKERIEQPRIICSFAFRLDGDDWVQWLPETTHPLYMEFRGLQIQSYGRDYNEQKAFLDKLHEKKGQDIFVASYRALQDEERIWSYCVWSKGVDALLPKTDSIMFAEEEQPPIMVEWNKAIEKYSDLMQPEDIYPPRWRVREYPNRDELLATGNEMAQ
jgi:hypothetical protein